VTPTLADRLADAERRYVERNPESRRLHELRARYMPGGNTRTVIHVSPFPLTIVHGEGARLANLLALSLARIATAKPAIMVFAGAYHGSVFSFVRGGSPINAPFRSSSRSTTTPTALHVSSPTAPTSSRR
jgi:glutamate-1-semialdehyde aminotransferase